MINWQPIITGIIVLASVGYKIFQQGGVVNPEDYALIGAGVQGLVSKQRNVSGGTVAQPSSQKVIETRLQEDHN